MRIIVHLLKIITLDHFYKTNLILLYSYFNVEELNTLFFVF